MVFKGVNLLGEEVHADGCGGRVVISGGKQLASISSTEPFNPFGEFALVNDRFITVLELVERVCRSNEGRGIAAIGANAALREMSKYWDSHLAEGHGHKIVVNDLRDAQINLIERIAELAEVFASGARPNKVAYIEDIARYALAGADTISDIRLAAKLAHTKQNGCTTLMAIEIGGESYALQLSGHISGYDHAKEESIDFSLSDDLIASLEKPVDERPEDALQLEMDNGPWFEWVNGNGLPVGDVMDSISLNPEKEVDRLKDLLSNRS